MLRPGLLLSPSRPIRTLAALFVLWKAFLLALALATAVGPDYDTSTALFFSRLYGPQARTPVLASRLTRWDALYFVHQARAGYVYEQDWAFGAALPTAVRLVVAALPAAVATPEAVLEPLVAVVLAHASHLIAVLALHRLTLLVWGNATLALVAAALHVLSPAGLFLSAPYAESPFAALSFVGFWLFALGHRNKHHPAKRALAVVSAGLVLGLATAFRTNGLASGLLFSAAALNAAVACLRAPRPSRLLDLAALLLGGLCVAMGSALPQAVAWTRFCRRPAAAMGPRPWCSRTVPSIYAFVQAEYWNVGFLRYWTLNQLPLFIIAAPMLAIMLTSVLAVFRDPVSGLGVPTRLRNGLDHSLVLRTLAASQMIVASMALTSYHVQVITRLSSGYPVWYWWVAACLLDKRRQELGQAVVVFMAMYAAIQGVLFASFLPPA